MWEFDIKLIILFIEAISNKNRNRVRIQKRADKANGGAKECVRFG